MDKRLTGCQIALPEDLKRANRRKILNIFRRGETVTIADIHRETEISKPTITRAVQHYCDSGMVRSLGLGSTTSGTQRNRSICIASCHQPANPAPKMSSWT